MYTRCEKERVNLRCDDTKTAPIIESATWGIQDQAVCPEPTTDEMRCFADVTETVKGYCDEKKCAFKANKRKLGEPCDATGTPIIKIEYKCPTEPPTCK